MSDTAEQWKQEATKDRKRIPVCFDRALVSALEEAIAELEQVQKQEGMLEPPLRLQEKVNDLRTRVEKKTHTIVFEAIGRQPWRVLLGDHPPTEEQKREGADHNPDTFPYAAMAASCSDPGLTIEQAEWLGTALPPLKFEEVWATCLAANVRGADEKKALASASPLRTEKRSRPPSSSGSPEASSSAE